MATSASGLPAAPPRGFWPRRLRPTREGWWFLSATLLLGLAAVNAGLNLLFAVLGMMLFLILASGVMSELCLQKLSVVRRLPSVIHAGTPYLMGISVRNDKRRLPTFSLEVEDLTAGKPVERRCYFLKLPCGREQETSYRNVLGQRGLHQLVGFRISTRFPFGLIRKSRDLFLPCELMVYPALRPVPPLVLTSRITETTPHDQQRRTRSGEFDGLRDFRVGDDPRQIHWRATAKRGRTLVRESVEEAGHRVLVVLDDDGTKDPGPQAAEAFEAAVSMAASVVMSLARQGYEVGLRAGDASLRPGGGEACLHEMLRTLAVVTRRSAGDVASSASGVARGTALVRIGVQGAHPTVSVSHATGDRAA